MNGNSHLIFGVSVAVFGVLITKNSDITDNALFVSECLMGSVFPDIDNPTSHIGQLTAPVSTFIGQIGKMAGKKGPNHRGFLHDPLLYIILIIMGYFFFPWLSGLFIGCLSHVFLDAFTYAGVRVLRFKRIRFAKFLSGSPESKTFTILLSILLVFSGIAVKYGLLSKLLSKTVYFFNNIFKI